MAGGRTGTGQPGLSAAARFELAALEQDGDQLVVTGAWTEVRGLRFVRPTLIGPDRAILASLDDKPWDPTARPWIARFPWHGPTPEPSELRLSVAPSITVEMASGEHVEPRFTRAPEPTPEPAPQAPPAPQQDELAALTAQRDAAIAERDKAIAERDRAIAERDEARRREQTAEKAMDVLRIDVTEARQSAERTARSTQEALARADHALRDAVVARQERDTARAALARPADDRGDGPVFGPLTSLYGTRTRELAGRELWGARAVIVVATIVAIVILLRVLG